MPMVDHPPPPLSARGAEPLRPPILPRKKRYAFNWPICW